MCAVALGRFGEGHVGFVGDVNHEDETWAVVAQIVKRLPGIASTAATASAPSQQGRANSAGTGRDRGREGAPPPPASPGMPGPSGWAQGLTLDKQYEWLIDCYRMRVDDDYAWGGGNLHGLYNVPASGVRSEDRSWEKVNEYVSYEPHDDAFTWNPPAPPLSVSHSADDSAQGLPGLLQARRFPRCHTYISLSRGQIVGLEGLPGGRRKASALCL